MKKQITFLRHGALCTMLLTLCLLLAQTTWAQTPVKDSVIISEPTQSAVTWPNSPIRGLYKIISVEAWGGGGGGGGAKGATDRHSVGVSGGGGAYAKETNIPVNSTMTFSYKVGAGGSQGTASNDGGDGGTSYFSSNGSAIVSAGGGKGGKSHNQGNSSQTITPSSSNGGKGGTATAGTTKIGGSDAGNSYIYGGAFKSPSTKSGDGGAGANGDAGADGVESSYFTSNAGISATGVGGGGSGASVNCWNLTTEKNGGQGAGGQIKFVYSVLKLTVTFNTNSDVSFPSKTIWYYDTMKTIQPANPTKNCYTFGGWYYDENFNQPVDWNQPCTKEQNFTLYAKWDSNFPSVTEDNPTVNHKNVKCHGGKGEFVVTASGGTGSTYTYEAYIQNTLVSQSSNGIFNNMSAATYSVKAYDVDNCPSNALEVKIEEPDTLIASISVTHVNCHGDSTGNAVLTVSGGTGPGTYSYLWNDQQRSVTKDLNNKPAGIYTVTVTDGNGCTAVATDTIKEPENALTITEATSTPVSCHAGQGAENDGTITITAAGGTPGYSYAKNNVADSYGDDATLTGFTAGGPYKVYVKDNKGCITYTEVTVAGPTSDPISFNAHTTTPANCHPDNIGVTDNGKIAITAQGGAGTLTYIIYDNNGEEMPNNPWDNGEFQGLVAGTYSVKATDAAGCWLKEENIVIGSATKVVITAASPANVSCYVGNQGNHADGTITVTVEGGNNSTYTYSKDSITYQNSNVLTDFSVGTYTVYAKDGNSCVAKFEGVVVGQPDSIIAIVTPTSANCYNGSGSVSVSANGGSNQFTYSWNTGASGATVENLTPGLYVVTVTDSRNCVTTAQANLTQPNQLVLNIGNLTAPKCAISHDGIIPVTVSGGTPGYTITWGSDGDKELAAPGTTNITDLAGGNYTVTLQDSKGCSVSQSDVRLNAPAALTITTGTVVNVHCHGGNDGQLPVTVAGGVAPYTIAWGGTDYVMNYAGEYTITELTAGSYTVTVTDANQCTAETSAIGITEPDASLLISEVTVANISCNADNEGQHSDGSITVSVTGATGDVTYSTDGVTYQASNVLSDLSAGSYTIYVKDAAGCSATKDTTVGAPAAMTIDDVTLTNPKCVNDANGIIVVTTVSNAQGESKEYALNYGVYQSSNTFENRPAGQYIITVKDAKNCVASRTVTLNQPLALSATATGNAVSCHTSNDGTKNDGSISVTLTNATYPCTYSLNGSVYGDSVDIIAGLTMGTYNVYVKDANGCTANVNSISVGQPAAFTITSATPTAVTVNNGTDGQIAIVATGAVKFLIGTDVYPTSPITGLSAGTYTVVAENDKGCQASVSVIVNEPDALTLTLDATDLTCNNNNSGVITANVTGGVPPYTYSKDGTNYSEENVFSDLAAGSYTIYVKDANNVTKSVDTTLTQPTVLTVTPGTITKVTCVDGNNGSVVMAIAGGTAPYTLTYDNNNVTIPAAGDTLIENLSAGTYSMMLTDANGCKLPTTVEIEAIDPLVVVASDTVDVKCNSGNTGSFKVTVSGGTANYILSWGGTHTMDAAGSYTVTDLTAGEYTLTVTDANGCTATTKKVVVSEPSELAMMTGVVGNLSCHGDANGYVPVVVNGGVAPYTIEAGTYSMTMASAGRDTLKNMKGGTYTIKVKDANECEISSDPVTIEEPDTLIITNTVTTNPSCNTANATDASGLLNDGKIEVTATGGIGSYSYSTDGTNYQTSNVLNTLTKGTYTVYVKDENGCITTKDGIEIGEPNAMSVSITATPAKCNGSLDGAATATVTNGVTPLTYAWSSNPPQSNANATILGAGKYPLLVTDANGCTVKDTATITEPDAMTADITIDNHVTCFKGTNGKATVSNLANATGTPTYAWTGSTSTAAVASDLTAGTHTVTITDENGCKLTKSVTLTQPDSLMVDIEVPTGAALQSCTQTVVANVTNATGTVTYSWAGATGSGSDNTATVTGVGAHTVTVTVTNNTCTAQATKSYTATQPDVVIIACGSDEIPGNAAIIAAINNTLSGCSVDASSAVFPAAGATFINDTIIKSSDNTYTVNVKKSMPTITLTASPANLCEGESTTLTATQVAGATYNWGTASTATGNEIVVTPDNSTTYTVTVTYGGCSNNATKLVTVNIRPHIADITTRICTGNELNAEITAGNWTDVTRFDWTVVSNTGVTGAGVNNANGQDETPHTHKLKFGQLTNATTAYQTIVYNVNPKDGACYGDAFTVTAIVRPSIENDAQLVFNAPDIEHTLYYGACDTLVNIVTPEFTTSIAEYAGNLVLTNNRSTNNSGAILGRVAPGDNTIIWTLTDSCGNTRNFTQHIIVKYPDCGTVTDANGNTYTSVRIGCECWTTSNLKSTTYASNLGGGEIPVALAYYANEYPDEDANVATFGRLYSWYSAVKVAEGDDNATPATQTASASGYNYVQGVCPAGWALPTREQYDNMMSVVNNTNNLKSDDVNTWLPGANGSNSTGFNAVASGYYDDATDSYFNLMGEAYYWSSSSTTARKGECSYITHTCPILLDRDSNKGMGFSVRCVQREQ